jgi:hypothetical protein
VPVRDALQNRYQLGSLLKPLNADATSMFVQVNANVDNGCQTNTNPEFPDNSFKRAIHTVVISQHDALKNQQCRIFNMIFAIISHVSFHFICQISRENVMLTE